MRTKGTNHPLMKATLSLRATALLALAVLACGSVASARPAASAGPDEHSKNIEQLVQAPAKISKKLDAEGSDLAFQGDLVIEGTYQGMALWRSLNKAPYLKQISFFNCPGAQGD